MQELLDLTFAWLGARNPCKLEGRSVYQVAASLTFPVAGSYLNRAKCRP